MRISSSYKIDKRENRVFKENNNLSDEQLSYIEAQNLILERLLNSEQNDIFTVLNCLYQTLFVCEEYKNEKFKNNVFVSLLFKILSDGFPLLCEITLKIISKLLLIYGVSFIPELTDGKFISFYINILKEDIPSLILADLHVLTIVSSFEETTSIFFEDYSYLENVLKIIKNCQNDDITVLGFTFIFNIMKMISNTTSHNILFTELEEDLIQYVNKIVALTFFMLDNENLKIQLIAMEICRVRLEISHNKNNKNDQMIINNIPKLVKFNDNSNEIIMASLRILNQCFEYNVLDTTDFHLLSFILTNLIELLNNRFSNTKQLSVQIINKIFKKSSAIENNIFDIQNYEILINKLILLSSKHGYDFQKDVAQCVSEIVLRLNFSNLSKNDFPYLQICYMLLHALEFDNESLEIYFQALMKYCDIITTLNLDKNLIKPIKEFDFTSVQGDHGREIETLKNHISSS